MIIKNQWNLSHQPSLLFVVAKRNGVAEGVVGSNPVISYFAEYDCAPFSAIVLKMAQRFENLVISWKAPFVNTWREISPV